VLARSIHYGYPRTRAGREAWAARAAVILREHRRSTLRDLAAVRSAHWIDSNAGLARERVRRHDETAESGGEG